MKQLELVDEFIFYPGNELGGTAAGRRRTYAFIAAFSLVVAIAGVAFLRSSSPAHAVALAYNFDLKGARIYDVSMEMKMTPRGVDGAEDFEGQVDGTLVMEVRNKAEDGSAVVVVRFRDVTVEPAVADVPADWGEMKMRVAPDGRITDVRGSGGLFAGAGTTLGAPLAAQGTAPADTAGTQYLFPRFPDDLVRPGDTWDEDASVELPFGSKPLVMKTEGRHKGYADTAYGEAVKLNHSVSAPFDHTFTFADIAAAIGESSLAIPPQFSSAAMEMRGSTEMDADSLVIPSTGEAVEMKGVVDMSMDIKVTGIPLPPGQGSEVGFDAKITIDMTRIDGAS